MFDPEKSSQDPEEEKKREDEKINIKSKPNNNKITLH